MSIDKNEKIDEFVDSEGGMISGSDRNPTSDSEIETGPTPKTWDDDSDYEKGVATTTDRATRYRQNIPWFAIYSYGDRNSRNLSSESVVPTIEDNEVNEKGKILTKRELEEDIKEDLVKKSKDHEVWSKDFDVKTEKIIDTIEDGDLNDNQLERIKKAVLDRISKQNA